jgi:hypothetical protein
MNQRRNPMLILAASVAALGVGIAACVIALMLLVHTVG